MAFDEEIQKFTHNVEEAFHDVEEAFQEVKEHVILSVRNHSYMIAFLLMSLTSAVLVFGTVYMWCFHHGHPHRSDKENTSKKSSESQSRATRSQKTVRKIQKLNINKLSASDGDSCMSNSPVCNSPESYSPSASGDTNTSPIASNGELRSRNVAADEEPGAASVNNNDSPVKSRIPVRRQKSKQS